MTDGPEKTTEQTQVLVVEDVARLREVLISSIVELGYRARGARSGEEALTTVGANPDDIILLDLNLPGMDGLEFFEEVRRRWPNTQVIILTGLGDLDAAQRAIRLGVVDFLSKPASLGDLELALNRAWRRCNQSLPPDPLHADATAAFAVDKESDSPRSLCDLEREHILAALDRNHGNRTAAAAELGISIRTLYYRLAQYEWQDWKAR